MTLTQIKLKLLSEHGIKTRGKSQEQIYDLALDRDLITEGEYLNIGFPTRPVLEEVPENIVIEPKPEPETTVHLIEPEPEVVQELGNFEESGALKALTKRVDNLVKTTSHNFNEMDSDLKKALIDMKTILDGERQATHKALSELAKKAAQSQTREIVVRQYEQPEVDPENIGVVHSAFAETLGFMAMGIDVFLYGPTGSGKSTTARKVAQAQKREFFMMGSLMTKFETLGAMTPHAGYSPSVIRKWLESENGLLCIDEIDASNPNALTSVMALFDRNGELTFPDGETLKRTPQHQIIITGNTIGAGGNAAYNSRVKLDDAFLTRFIRISHDYDKGIEDHLGGREVAAYARKFRAQILKKKLHGAIITPRTIEYLGQVNSNPHLESKAKFLMFKSILKQGLNENDYKSITGEVGELKA